MTRRRLIASGAAVSLPVVLAACGGGSSGGSKSASQTTDAKPKKGGRLRIGHVGAGKDESLDPGIGAHVIDIARFRQLFDTIARKAPDGSGTELVLAESLEPNADGTVWNMKLRSGVQFHNGKTMTADDVIYSLRRPFDTKAGLSGSALASVLDPKTGFKKVGDLEIEFHLTSPSGDLGALMTFRDASIYPEGFTDFKHPIGTGPFSFVSFTVGERSLFKRNDNYWQKGGGPYVSELEIITIPDSAARANALLGGEIDIADGFDYDQARAYKDDKRVVLLNSPTTSGYQFVQRTDTKPFTDNNVRLAFKLCADRQQMIDVAFAGFGKVQNDMFGKGLAGYPDDIPQREYDPEQAKSLLAKAGFADGIDIDIYYDQPNGALKAATAYVEQAKAAGVNIKVKQFPPNTDFATAPKFPLWCTNWGGDILNVGTYFLSSSSYNEGWFNKGWDKIFKEATGTLDKDRRIELMKELNTIWHNEGPHVIWGSYNTIDALAPNVRGAVPVAVEFGLSNYDLKSYWLA